MSALPHTGYIYHSDIVQVMPPVRIAVNGTFFVLGSNVKIIHLLYNVYYFPADIFFFQDLRRKAARLIAAKCTLAARVDAAHESADGSFGRQLKEEIEKKFDKLTVKFYLWYLFDSDSTHKKD